MNVLANTTLCFIYNKLTTPYVMRTEAQHLASSKASCHILNMLRHRNANVTYSSNGSLISLDWETRLLNAVC